MTSRLSTGIKIFDFDLTLTIVHSFSEFGLTETTHIPFRDNYQQGREFAKEYATKNAPLLHDANHIGAIATHHNNPVFVAGAISHMLDKKLTYCETFTSLSPETAVDVFAVEGCDRPFLISYIPELEEDAYLSRRNQINFKNDQIHFLTAILLEKKQITKTALIDFYDDTEENIRFAQEIPGVVVHHVKDSNHFTVYPSPNTLKKPGIMPSILIPQPSIKYSFDNELVFQFVYGKLISDKTENEVAFFHGEKGQIISDFFSLKGDAETLAQKMKDKLASSQEMSSSIKVYESRTKKGFFRVVLTPKDVELVKKFHAETAQEKQSQLDKESKHQIKFFKSEFSLRNRIEKMANNNYELTSEDFDILKDHVSEQAWSAGELTAIRDHIAEHLWEKSDVDQYRNIIFIKPVPETDLYTMALRSTVGDEADLMVKLSKNMILDAIFGIAQFEERNHAEPYKYNN